MMFFGLLYMTCAPIAIAEQPAAEPPQTTQGVQRLHARVDMTYWQNWAFTGGASLTGISTLASGIAALITSMSSEASCATTIKWIENKRDFQAIGVEAMALNLREQGYVQTGQWIHHGEGNKTFDGYFSNGELRFENLYVMGNFSGGLISSENNTETSDLSKRTTYSSSQIAFEYHSYKGTCKTRLTKAQLKEAAEVQLHYMSNSYDKCSCWTYTGGHGWYGEVKLMETYDGDDYSAQCYNKACNAT
ncbi:hypothetical protein N7513_001968 [Penicillium frequentans]|nr:hypothetical protein N7513_001968 [Penicillium glabrum]